MPSHQSGLASVTGGKIRLSSGFPGVLEDQDSQYCGKRRKLWSPEFQFKCKHGLVGCFPETRTCSYLCPQKTPRNSTATVSSRGAQTRPPLSFPRARTQDSEKHPTAGLGQDPHTTNLKHIAMPGGEEAIKDSRATSDGLGRLRWLLLAKDGKLSIDDNNNAPKTLEIY